MKRTCLNCDYPLDGLDRHRCPECGQPFDPDDSRTFDGGAGAPRDRGLCEGIMSMIFTALAFVGMPVMNGRVTWDVVLMMYGIVIVITTLATGLAIWGYRRGQWPAKSVSAVATGLGFCVLFLLLASMVEDLVRLI